jgi:hypothetical protein
MFITGLLLAFFLAILFTVIFATGLRGHGWGMGLLFFFLILFLATWAGGLWLTPIGPLWLGVPWFSYLLVALIIGLLLATLTPDRRLGPSPSDRDLKKRAAARAETLIAVDVLFWFLILGLLIAIVARYAAVT